MPPPRPLRSDQIPQASDLARVRWVLSAISQGEHATAALAERANTTPRQVSYALAAARILGWLGGPEGLSLTSSGMTLLSTAPGSDAERSAYRRAITASDPIRQLAPDLLAPQGPSLEELSARILSRTVLSESTARRRAQTLLAWRAQAFEAAGVKESLVETVTSAAALPEMRLPLDLERDLRRNNPWWEGRAGVLLPPTRRDFVGTIHRRLSYRLAPIVAVRGPRQVGKTVAQLQLIDDLLRRGVPPTHILRVQCDEIPALPALLEPILRVVDWYEEAILGKTLNAAAHAGEPTYLFFDEVQNLPSWAIQLKFLVDSTTTQVVVTGSSALRIEAGRDSLAGRINTLEVGTLTLREIARIRSGEELKTVLNGSGLDALTSPELWRELKSSGMRQAALRDRAFSAFSARGGYPLVHTHPGTPWADVADQLNETVIRRVIQHDLRLGSRGRKRDARLLEELFRIACRYAGQCPGPDLIAEEARRALKSPVEVKRALEYLDFLDRTLLLRMVRPIEIRLKRSQGAPKLCLADHGLRASWLQEVVPLDPVELQGHADLSPLAGRIAESIVGTYLLNASGLDVAHFPERPEEPEVDFVLTIGTRRIPVEIKYRRRVDAKQDTRGLRSFLDRKHYDAPFGILVTQTDEGEVDDPRIICLPLSSLLLLY